MDNEVSANFDWVGYRLGVNWAASSLFSMCVFFCILLLILAAFGEVEQQGYDLHRISPLITRLVNKLYCEFHVLFRPGYPNSKGN